jgi:hypothetical protein
MDNAGNQTGDTAKIYVDSLPSQPSTYPASAVITGVQWAPVATIVRAAAGSDNWPLAWADDGELYVSYGDGWGFAPPNAQKLSLGYARVSGPATAFVGENIPSRSGEQRGDGPNGKKASGLLMVSGTLYQWVRNANNNGEQCELAWSTDHASTWTWSNWRFSEFGYCAFLDFGPNYAGARDGYVYMVTPDTPSAYKETDHLVLTRVPSNRIRERDAYEVFAGMDGPDKPRWTMDIAARQPVFSFVAAVNRVDVSYHPVLGRYLMTLRSQARNGGRNQFSIFEGQEPWGPWSAVYYTERWEGALITDDSKGWGEAQHLPPKWMSNDGREIFLVFSGEDAFSIRKGTLTVQRRQ